MMPGVAWKSLPKNMGNNLHSICSYMAMFPPSIPHHFIDKYTKPGERVLDPFSGRGTAPLEACCMGRYGIGNDKNPLAYVLTFAKTNTPQKGRILSRLEALEQASSTQYMDTGSVDWQIRMIFSERTLQQLLYLRQELKWSHSNVDAFIAALILGIIHGNSPGYLSLSMPNTFSMSPQYVKSYIKKNGLKKPERDVFTLLRRKLERCYQRPAMQGKTYNRDARTLGWIDDESIDLVVTSPPYTRVMRYGAFNWIRLWFLAEDARQVDSRLLCTQSLSKYLDFMTEALEEMHRVISPSGHAVLVIGDVRDKATGVDLNLAHEVWNGSAEPAGFILKESIMDGFNQDAKVSRIWGEKKKGRATKVDRILVLQRT